MLVVGMNIDEVRQLEDDHTKEVACHMHVIRFNNNNKPINVL